MISSCRRKSLPRLGHSSSILLFPGYVTSQGFELVPALQSFPGPVEIEKKVSPEMLVPTDTRCEAGRTKKKLHLIS